MGGLALVAGVILIGTACGSGARSDLGGSPDAAASPDGGESPDAGPARDGGDERDSGGEDPDPRDRVTINEGLWGTVYWLEGNHMPGGSNGTTEPLSTEVRAHEPATRADATPADRPDSGGLHYREIGTALVGSTVSGEDGFWEISLPPGSYSVFADDGGDWYCNGTSPEGLCVWRVEPGSVTEVQIRIDYMADY